MSHLPVAYRRLTGRLKWLLSLCPSACTSEPVTVTNAQHEVAPLSAVETAPERAREVPAFRCTDGPDEIMNRRCSELWGQVRGDDVASVPLNIRCELAAVLGAAVVDTLSVSRTTWYSLNGDVFRLKILLGGDAGASPLISEGEGCPITQALRYYHPPEVAPTIAVEVLSELDALAHGDDVVLRLADACPVTCACTAGFIWDLGDRPKASETTQEAPLLVVAVTMTPSGGFSASKKAIELP